MPLPCSPVLTDRPALPVVALAGLLAACGAREPQMTQTAARVNKDEITVHQIAAALAQQPVRPEQTAQAERQALERLIDRQLAVQQAFELKLDREPKVVQAIEAARQDVLARAYADRLGDSAARPTAGEIKKYHDEHPALFQERRVYQLQEFAIEASAQQLQAVEAALPSMTSADDAAARLQSLGLKFSVTPTVRPAEQLPLALLPALARLTDGQALLRPMPQGAQLLVLVGSRAAPVDEATASRAIEQFLVNEHKRKRVADDLKALRTAAHIDYRGRFAASAVATAVNEPADADAQRAVQPTHGIDVTTVNKGLGLK